MPRPALIALVVVCVAVLAMPALMWLQGRISNPGVARELRDQPQGERARRVMLLTLPSGREIPVNFLRENGRLYVGADGLWWRELVVANDEPSPIVPAFVQGESLTGRARAARGPGPRDRLRRRRDADLAP